MHLRGVVHMAWLMLHFRNGATLVESMRAERPADELVLWDGTRIAHPAGREGLLEAVQEIWLEHVYTAGFYRPGDGDVVVDAGANVGIFAIHTARQNRRCRVVALEPFAENFQYLEANVARACPNNVRCCEMALGGSYGQAQMEAVGTRSLDHVMRAGASSKDRTSGAAAGIAYDVQASDDGNVQVIPLSGLFDLTGSGEIDFLKVDIEGSERDVFAAATSDALRRIKHIAMEYHDRIVPGTLELVRNVLAPTHDITVRPSTLEGCGILLGRRRESTT